MRPVELMEVLEAREARVYRQQELLEKYNRPLVCFTMNIAGPIKNSEEIAWGFNYGSGLLLRQMKRVKAPVLYHQILEKITGNEGFFVVDLDPVRLKELMVELEDNLEIGRLFDLDVLSPDGQKLTRPHERGCIICGAVGKSCARSRAHSVEQLQERTTDILKRAYQTWKADIVGEFACRALLYEACTTPKPGLVDRCNSGSHSDMDLFSFLSSASALRPYFTQCVRIGCDTIDLSPQETFSLLRWPGKMAEMRMLHVTGGVNTHKGAIFTLGVLCGALGRLDHHAWETPERILAECSLMTCGLSDQELKFRGTTETAGEQIFQQLGVSGIRGQVEAGLPAVRQYGLPELMRQIEQGASLEYAGCMALLSLILHTDDTNLLKRGGLEGQKWATDQINSLLSGQNLTIEDVKELDQRFIDRNLSPGGAADLLAVCYFLYFLMQFDWYS